MKTWGILFSVLFTLPLLANQPIEEKVELRKKITKAFDAPISKTISASNRYGKITVVTYSGQQVKYDIDIVAKASSQAKAQKDLDRVSIIFEDSPAVVSATTEIEDKTAWFTWSWSGNAELDIKYTVYVPDGRKLDLNQKYGNILMPVYNGACTLETAYGNIEASDINAPYVVNIRYGNGRFGCIKSGTINLKYSDMTANSVEKAEVDIKYGKLLVDNAHNLIVNSKYSNYNIGNCNTLSFSGGYDHVIVKECGKLNYENKYGELEMGTLSGNASIIGSYHTTSIREIRSGVTSIQIEGSYGNVNLSSQGGYQYVVEGKYTSVKKPGQAGDEDEDEDGKTLVKGSKKGGGPKISIIGSYNSVVLK